MIGVGFDPTPPKRLEPYTSALDRSAIQPRRQCNRQVDPFFFLKIHGFQGQKVAKNNWSGIRTRASEETSALNCRLRPLGHSTSVPRAQWGKKNNIDLSSWIRTSDLGISANITVPRSTN